MQTSKSMKYFLLKIGLFFLALIVMDRVAGIMFSFMLNHAKGGYIGHHKYVTDKTNEDILIFGSSRAIHHYNPKIISDSLGMTCYNCGQDGNGIILFYGLWQMIKERHTPKMIIFDVNPDFDLYKGENNQRYLGWLRSDYEKPGVKSVFTTIDPTESYKMESMLYRYNSKFMQVLTDFIHPIFTIKGNGYLPLKGKMNKMKVKKKSDYQCLSEVDSVKLEYINKFIDETSGIRLVFVASPSWYYLNRQTFQPIKDICKKRNIQFLDFSESSKYIHNDAYFKDGNHLNASGADEFTKELAKTLKRGL